MSRSIWPPARSLEVDRGADDGVFPRVNGQSAPAAPAERRRPRVAGRRSCSNSRRRTGRARRNDPWRYHDLERRFFSPRVMNSAFCLARLHVANMVTPSVRRGARYRWRSSLHVGHQLAVSAAPAKWAAARRARGSVVEGLLTTLPRALRDAASDAIYVAQSKRRRRFRVDAGVSQLRRRPPAPLEDARRRALCSECLAQRA